MRVLLETLSLLLNRRACYLLAILSVAACSSPRPEPGPVLDLDYQIKNLAVLPIPGDALLPLKQEQLLNGLAAAIQKRYKIPAMTGLSMGRAVWGELDNRALDAAHQFRGLLSEAKDAHDRLLFSKALRLLTDAQGLLPWGGADIRDATLLTDLFVLTGAVYLMREKPKDAETVFRLATAINPDLAPGPKTFMSGQGEVFEHAKRILKSGNAAHMEVLSWPEGATVYVDGRRAGIAPLKQLALYPGQHFIRLELKDHGVWTLNLPDQVPPGSIRAWMFPNWPDQDLPEDLLEEVKAGEEVLSAEAMAQLARIASLYKVDGVLLVAFSMKAHEVQLSTKLYIAPTGAMTGEGVFNLGADEKTHKVRLDQMVRVYKELKKRPKARPKARPKQKQKPKPKPKSDPQVKNSPDDPTIEELPEPDEKKSKRKKKRKRKRKKKRKKKT